MDWLVFPYITVAVSITFILVVWLSITKRNEIVRNSLLIFGIGLMLAFNVGLWITLGRPPMRTLAETRLWYSFFLSVVGSILFFRWKMDWMLYYSIVMTMVFMFINLLKPDTYDQALMPALQSPWFVPHVIVYIIGYALLAASSLIGLQGIWLVFNKKSPMALLKKADDVVYVGFAFLTFGLLFGALWAKEAWGHYWTWDPKETWAFLTWFMYLIYIHLRYNQTKKYNWALWSLSLAFVVLLICWFGINYLPSAANSVHNYSS